MSRFAEWEFTHGSLEVTVDRGAAQPRRIIHPALARVPHVAVSVAAVILVLTAHSSSGQNASPAAAPRLELVKDVRPVYPAIASSVGIEGVVKIEARIGPDGRVVEARVIESIPLFDNAALDAVRQWTFVPPAGDTRFVATVHFVL